MGSGVLNCDNRTRPDLYKNFWDKQSIYNRHKEEKTTYEKVIDIYMSGITTPVEIAKKLNVHRTTASRYLKKAMIL
jgi:DNA invertase Pin-like site-specific DNA recombinase